MRWVDGFNLAGEVMDGDWVIWRGWGLASLEDLMGRLTYGTRPVIGPDWPEIVRNTVAAARESQRKTAIYSWYAWGGAYSLSVVLLRRLGLGWSVAACSTACQSSDQPPDRGVLYVPWSYTVDNPAYEVLAQAHARRVTALLRRLGWESQSGKGVAVGLWSIWREGPVLLGRVDVGRFGSENLGLEGFIYIPGLGVIERRAREMFRWPSPMAGWFMELGMKPGAASRAARAIKRARRPEVAVRYALAAMSS